MAGSTPARGIPYPSPTDPINAYPALAQTAAENLDAHTHDKTTVSTAGRADTAASADYATQAGNADTVDGLHASNFMSSTAIYVGRIQVTLDNGGRAWVNAGGKTSVIVANVNADDFTGAPVSYAVKWPANNNWISVTYSGSGTWQYATGAIALNVVAV